MVNNGDRTRHPADSCQACKRALPTLLVRARRMQWLRRAIKLGAKAIDRLRSNVRFLMHIVRRIFRIQIVKRFGRILQMVVNAIEVDAGIEV